MTLMPFPEAADRVKAAIDIVEIVSRHVRLKKAGRNYQGLCPFHPEKTPSFSVNREKNLFKCFGCGEGGDALTFLMRLENKTYGQLIRELAKEQGIEIQHDGQTPEVYAQQRKLEERILDLNTQAGQWFSQQLAENTSIRAYLAQRGISPAMQTQFQLGLAPDGWENLSQHLLSQNPWLQVEPSLLVTAGLASAREASNSYYDRFRNRLMIPIINEQGQCVAFGGRVLTPPADQSSQSHQPKYLNSPETPVYQKSRVLYGLYQAKEAIRQARAAVVMEGYFDVISAHQVGLAMAVGSCGTALTAQHVKLLARFGAETLYLCFDSDEAGLKAALNAIGLLENTLSGHEALSVRVIVVPEGKDPDGFLQQQSSAEQAQAAFKTLMQEALPWRQFQFAMALRGLNVNTPEGRIEGANRIAPLLAKIANPVEQMEYLRQLAEQLRLQPETLALEVKRHVQRLGLGTSLASSLFSAGGGMRFSGKPYPQNPYQPGALQKFSKKGGKTDPFQAISMRATRSLKQLESPAMRQQTLVPGHLQAEQNLLRLLLLDLSNIEPRLAQSIRMELCTMMKPLTFSDPVHQQVRHYLLDYLLNDLQTEVSLGQQAVDVRVLLDSLEMPFPLLESAQSEENQQQHAWDPHAVRRLLTDLIFTADSWQETFGWQHASGGALQQKIMQHAQHYCAMISSHQERQRLRALAQKAQQLEEAASQMAQPQLQPGSTGQANNRNDLDDRSEGTDCSDSVDEQLETQLLEAQYALRHALFKEI